jgi:hypothetical protein
MTDTKLLWFSTFRFPLAVQAFVRSPYPPPSLNVDALRVIVHLARAFDATLSDVI